MMFITFQGAIKNNATMVSRGVQESNNIAINQQKQALFNQFNKQKARFLSNPDFNPNQKELISKELNLDPSKMTIGFYLFDDNDFSNLFFSNYTSGSMEQYIENFKKFQSENDRNFQDLINGFRKNFTSNEFNINKIFRDEMGFFKNFFPFFYNTVEKSMLSMKDGEIEQMTEEKGKNFQSNLLECVNRYMQNLSKKENLINNNNLANALFKQNLNIEYEKYKEYYTPLLLNNVSMQNSSIVNKFCEKFSQRDIHEFLKYFSEMPNILALRNFINEIQHDRYNIFSFMILAPYMHKFYIQQANNNGKLFLENIFYYYTSEQYNYANIQYFLLSHNFSEIEIKDIYEKFVFLSNIYTDCFDTLTKEEKGGKYSVVLKDDYAYNLYKTISRIREDLQDKSKEIESSLIGSSMLKNLIDTMNTVQFQVTDIERKQFHFKEICEKILIKFSRNQYIPKGGLSWSGKFFTFNEAKIREAIPKQLQGNPGNFKNNYIEKIYERNQNIITRQISVGDEFNKFIDSLLNEITQDITHLKFEKSKYNQNKLAIAKTADLTYTAMMQDNIDQIENYENLSLENFDIGKKAKNIDIKIQRDKINLSEQSYKIRLEKLEKIQITLKAKKSNAVNDLRNDIMELINTIAKSLYYCYKLFSEIKIPIEKSLILDSVKDYKDRNILEYILNQSIESFQTNKGGIFLTSEADLEYYKSKKSENIDKCIIRALVLRAFLDGKNEIEYNLHKIPLHFSCLTKEQLEKTLGFKENQHDNNLDFNRLKEEINKSFETIRNHEENLNLKK